VRDGADASSAPTLSNLPATGRITPASTRNAEGLVTYPWCLLLAVAALSVARADDVAAPASRAEDLRIFEREYLERSPAFSPSRLREARARIAQLEPRVDGLDALQFFVAISRIVALADNGHDSVMRGDTAWSPTMRLPLRMIWFPDGLTVARAAPGDRGLLGAKVTSIDGQSPGQLLRALREVQGGTDDYRQWTVSWLLHSTEAMHAFGITRHPDRVTLELQLRDGRTIRRTIAAVPVAELPTPPRVQFYWYPSALEGEAGKGWVAAAPLDAVPLYLQEPESWFRMTDLPDPHALYVQFRSNADEDGSPIAPFVAQVMQRLQSDPPRNLVLDLRFDTGGDNTQNRELMRVIAETVPGRIYVLLGNFTFSAGIASAAALKHDGGDRVVLVGGPVGDRMHWWSEHERVCLPDSGLCVFRNGGYWDLLQGCKDVPGCYSDQFDVLVRSLEPDLPAPVRASDWLAGRDPALEAVRADLARSSLPATTR